ncbi:unnamed protein product [Microthlaspi erraticum]|uniref:Uncharacterized protein n=1 Tax=Microthlaspi erraticum TaxID=1685480 RepID=A0A6D2IAY4_9BRAS|nr:unnamed protein product [Microthlaspi erraticum]
MLIVGTTLMAEQNLSTLDHVLSSRPTHHPISFHLHLTIPPHHTCIPYSTIHCITILQNQISKDWSRRLQTENASRPRNGRPRNIVPRAASGHTVIRPERTAELTYRPGKHQPAVDHPKSRLRPRTTAPREQGGIASRPCAQPCHTHDPSVRSGRLVSRPAEPSTKSSVRPNPTNERKSLGHDRPDRADSRSHPIAGRTSRPTSERSGRPEAVFEARFTRFKPNYMADLLDLGLAALQLRAI